MFNSCTTIMRPKSVFANSSTSASPQTYTALTAERLLRRVKGPLPVTHNVHAEMSRARPRRGWRVHQSQGVTLLLKMFADWPAAGAH